MSRVDHLSYSAIVTFLNNQVEFQKRYIAKIYDNPKTPSLVVGTSFECGLCEFTTCEVHLVQDRILKALVVHIR